MAVGLFLFIKKNFVEEKGKIEETTEDIDISIKILSEKVETLIDKNENYRIWDNFDEVLESLRGYWLEYIPKRESKGCEFSIAYFQRDKKHIFGGFNYISVNGSIHYHWESIKVLPPILIDDDTLHIYNIYKRKGNTEYENKHGFSKLAAKRRNKGFDFVQGYFFNEATPDDNYFLMKLFRLSQIESFVQLEVEKTLENEELMTEFFKKLKSINFIQNFLTKKF